MGRWQFLLVREIEPCLRAGRHDLQPARRFKYYLDMKSLKNITLKLNPNRYLLLMAIQCILASCKQQSNQVNQLQQKVDSLQKQLAETYKPGFGEFMSGIQTHHAKLWFAGINQNWPLADFEVHEIQESLDDIRQFCKDRPEVKAMGMINPAIDSVVNAVRQKDLTLFKSDFMLLTSTCNNCHKATDHGFNIVTAPTSLPVVNQDFKPGQ